jgi:hypothetical protein
MGIRISYKSKRAQRLIEVEEAMNQLNQEFTAELDALVRLVHEHMRDLNMHGHQDYFTRQQEGQQK